MIKSCKSSQHTEPSPVLNGINNPHEESAPGYAESFSEELSNASGEEIHVIPVYCGQPGNWGFVVGFFQVIKEMLNIDIYTSEIINFILTDLEENPLAEGEKITLIGYSGGGQLALNVMEKIGMPIENVVLIGSPVAEVWNTNTKISMIYSSNDLFSWNIGFGYDSYYAGHLSHQEYFSRTNVGRIAQMVAEIIA